MKKMKYVVKTCLYWCYAALRWVLLIPALLLVLLAVALGAVAKGAAELADLSVLPKVRRPLLIGGALTQQRPSGDEK